MIAGSTLRRVAALPLYAFSLLPFLAHAQELPSGGTTVSGDASVGASGGAMTVTQTTDRSIVEWDSFSIGTGGAVRFDNGSGATLNRVTGSDVSRIDGALTATGSVYLVNGNGVIVGKNGVVNTGGSFVASTLDIDNDAFNAGVDLTFEGSSYSQVLNLGKIGSSAGDVVLIAQDVQNSGSLSAANGTVGLLAGRQVILRDTALDDGKFAVTTGSYTSVANGGTIAGASAELRAAGGNVYALAGNTAGTITATGVKQGDGRVWLVATSGNDNFSNTFVGLAGTITARGPDGGAGRIEATARNVQFISPNGGGGGDEQRSADFVGDGGDSPSQGGAVTMIDAGKGGLFQLSSNQVNIGDAGAAAVSYALNAGTNVTLNARGTITPDYQLPGSAFVTAPIAWTGPAALSITAPGYGFVGVSAPISLSNGTLNLSADMGEIDLGSTISVSGAGAVNLTAGYDPYARLDNIRFGTFDPTFPGNPSIDFGSTDQGAALSINGNAYTLVYSMAQLDGIDFYDSVNDQYLGKGQRDQYYALATTIADDANTYHDALIYGFDGTFNGLGNRIVGPTIKATGNSSYVGLFGIIGPNAVIRDLHLSGTKVTAYATGLEAIGTLAGVSDGTISNVTADNGSITVNVDNSEVLYVGGLIGAARNDETGPRGSITASGASVAIDATVSGDGAALYAGGLVGEAHSTLISGSRATGDVTAQLFGASNGYIGGLVGYSDNTIVGSKATGAVLAYQSIPADSVSGGDGNNAYDLYVGGLAGFASNGGFLVSSSATGAVDAAAEGERLFAGGLIGAISAISIDGSTASGSVTATAQNSVSYAGGLIGAVYQFSNISRSSASGDVDTGLGGSALHGGLIGYLANGSVSQSFATGNVTSRAADATLGGLVGGSDGDISTSYATGAVRATNGGEGTEGVSGLYAEVGGLVGFNYGKITNSYASGDVLVDVSQEGYVGGLLGQNNGNVSDVYALGSVTGRGGHASAGGLIGLLGDGSLYRAYATGRVTSDAAAGGLVGYSDGADAKALYFDTQTTGQKSAVGVGEALAGKGLTTKQMMNPASFVGFNFSTVPGTSGNAWVIVGTNGTLNAAKGGATRPMLLSEYSTTLNTAHQVQLMALDLNAYYRLGSDIDMSGTARASDVWGGTASGGYVAIGQPASTGAAFNGVLDGGGDFTIANLTTTRRVGYQGLFAGLGYNAQIRNLSLANFAVSGGTTSSGAVASVNDGAIYNVYVTGGSVTGTGYVGGLVGQSTGYIADGSASITVKGKNAGGIVGLNAGTIEDVSSAGTVTGTSAAGGITAINNGYIDLASNQGTVTGVSQVGGIAGRSTGTIQYSDNHGAVQGSSNVGGVVGYAINVTINSVTNGGDVTGGTFVGGIIGRSDGGALAGSRFTGTVTGTGVGTGGIVGSTTGSISDSIMNGAVRGASRTGGIAGTVGKGGSITASYVLDKDGLAASTLGNVHGTDYVGGIAGYVAAGGTVADIQPDADATSVTGSSIVGGLVGGNLGSIANAVSNATVSANKSQAGGLVGSNAGTVSNASASGSVSGADYVGGLIGRNTGAVVNGTATGRVTARGSHKGAKYGSNSGTDKTDASTQPTTPPTKQPPVSSD